MGWWPKRIGVVIQTQEHAAIGLRTCVELAQRAGASVHVIDVSELPPRWRRGPRGAGTGEDEIRRRREVVERFVSHVRTGEVGVSIAVRQGKRVVELVHEVAGAGVDLVAIVAPEAGQSPATVEAFANRVVRTAPVPVLVLRPSENRRGGVVAAVDVFADDDELAAAIVANGVALAGPDSELTALHVLETDGQTPTDESEDDLVASALAEARCRLEALLARLDPVAATPASPEVRTGSPVEEVLALVSSRRPWLLTVGTVSRGDSGGLMLGNTAEALLRTVECSVLATKPARFRSPLL